MRKPINYFEDYRDPTQAPDITKKQIPNTIAAELKYQQALGINISDAIKIEGQKQEKLKERFSPKVSEVQPRTDVNQFIKKILGFRDSVQDSKLQKLVLPTCVALGVVLGNVSQEPSNAIGANISGPKTADVNNAKIDVSSPEAQEIKLKLRLGGIPDNAYSSMLEKIGADPNYRPDVQKLEKYIKPALDKKGVFYPKVAIKKLGLRYLININNSSSAKVPNIKPENQEKSVNKTAPIPTEKIAGPQHPPATISSEAPKPAITSKPPENTKPAESSNPETKTNPQIPSPQSSETKNKPEKAATPPAPNPTESAKPTENTIPMFKREGKSVVWDKDSSDYQNMYRWSGAKNLAELEVFIYDKLDLDFKTSKVTIPDIVKAFEEYKNKNPKSQADCALGDTFNPNPRGLFNWFGNPYCEKTAKVPKTNSFLSKIKRIIPKIPLVAKLYNPELKSEPVPQSIDLVKAAFKKSLEPQNIKNVESVIYSQLVNDLKLEEVDSTLRLSIEAKMPIIIPMISRTLELGRARDETGLAEGLKEIATVYREIRTPVREEVARLHNEQVVINYEKADQIRDSRKKSLNSFNNVVSLITFISGISWFISKRKKS